MPARSVAVRTPQVRFADAASAKGWDSLAQQARENTYRAWTTMRTDPGPVNETPGTTGSRAAWRTAPTADRPCEQWQIEVTGGGRIWYLLDTARDTCWITFAGTGHPRATDRR
ncbi:hypothetical protein ACFYRY_09895 [Streptomyces sp. NPDC005263]|uniref:hypothetical protein n=1 Tax=Streptomyces sp. NPDC005263 TaxID=3364711 RepID=UPI0036B27451